LGEKRLNLGRDLGRLRVLGLLTLLGLIGSRCLAGSVGFAQLAKERLDLGH